MSDTSKAKGSAPAGAGAKAPPGKARPRAAVTARSVAGKVLARTIRDGAFAAAVLDTELDRAVQLEDRDRGLCTELVYGALRMRAFVDDELQKAATKGRAKLDPDTHAHLLVAGFQLFGLDRVPAFAAVNEAVSLVRASSGDRVAAFANALLRKLAERAKGFGPDERVAAQVKAAPRWMRESLTRALGKAGADAFMASACVAPPVSFRIALGEDREQVMTELGALLPDAQVSAGRASPRAILVTGAGSPRPVVDALGARRILVQEEGSQLVAEALGVTAGETVLDACAGRGNKTSFLAEVATCDAADLHPQKLERLRIELGSRGLAVRETFAVDWTLGAGDATGPYDAVLIDAPCTGIGTLRRRPELWQKRTFEGLQELGKIQRGVLLRAASLVRPGGRVVYATCSVLREEGEDVVEWFLQNAPEFRSAPFAGPRMAGLARESADPTMLRLLPDVHGTDGYFVASFVRA